MKKKQKSVNAGCPSLREAKKVWSQLGGTIRYPRRTGEALFEDPRVGRVRVNNRRTDCPRKLLVALRKLADLDNAPGRDGGR